MNPRSGGVGPVAPGWEIWPHRLPAMGPWQGPRGPPEVCASAHDHTGGAKAEAGLALL